jgi:hypothetical protein
MHITLQGTLDPRHNKTHLPHAFTLPPGTTELVIRYEQRAEGSAQVEPQVSLSLFDPERARGARHCNDDQNLRLTDTTATPGYTPGALIPGVWTVWIDVHRLLEGSLVHYKIDISLDDAPVTDTPPHYRPGTTAPRGAGWYRGDLHGHTYHSDAVWDVPEFVQHARENRLDFVTLTDHNTVSPLAQHDSLGDDGLLTMGGVELTTYYGHALALGVREWQEWRAGLNGLTMPELAQQAVAAGALYIIAHPLSVGDPWCTGCNWQFEDMMPGSARCVEIWNGTWDGGSGNEGALALWHGWLNEGYRMVATAGTDIHGPLTHPNDGFSVVYADELSEPAILSAIRRGHLYVSAGPQIELNGVSADGARAMMGDLLPRGENTLTVRWRAASAGDRLRLIKDGAIHDERPIEAEGSADWTFTDGRWYTAEIRAASGEVRAATNPIFIGAESDWR